MISLWVQATAHMDLHHFDMATAEEGWVWSPGFGPLYNMCHGDLGFRV